MVKVYAFTGRMFAGKDTIIDQMGIPKLGLADPIYTLVECLHGSRDKAVPSIRGHMQRLYRWGMGCMNVGDLEDEREATQEYLWQHGKTMMAPEWAWVGWQDYGQEQFWLSILEHRLCKIKAAAVAVTSIRWSNELQWVFDSKHTHVHVACLKETRDQRMNAAGYLPLPGEVEDASETLSRELDSVEWNMNGVGKGKTLRVWNEPVRSVPHCDYLTVANFLAKIKEKKKSVYENERTVRFP